MDARFEITVPTRHLAAVPHGRDRATVCVVGNVHELGAWNTTNAVPLALVGEKEDENTYVVTVTFSVAREFAPVEYKYILKDSQTDEVVSWETIPGNRTFTLTRAANAALNKPAIQSSTYATNRVPSPGPRPGSMGNDGSHNGFHEWRCPRTMREQNPWWSVDLEATVSLSHLTLWKAMTYHEQPKRSTAQPPASAIAAGTNASALPPPRVWIVLSTEDLKARSGNELIEQLSHLPETMKAFPLELHENVRVESAALGDVKARYVRIQYESDKNALQFSELEVFADAGGAAGSMTRADGYYGVGAASDTDLTEYVDAEWVDPVSKSALVRLWIGSFQKDVPAIQWCDGSSNTRPIHATLRHQLLTCDGAKAIVQEVPVDARGASLLDKDGADFRASLATDLQKKQRDVKSYLNASEAKSLEEWLHRFQQTFTEDEVARIRSEATTRTFHDGEMLLQYGERLRTAFFIVEGEVDVNGPSTVTGAISLGSLTADSALNDLALFSSWPTRSASFIAKGPVVARVITYDLLKRVVGDAKLRTLRHHLLRERANASVQERKNHVFVDKDHAQVFRTKVSETAFSPASGHQFVLEFYEATDGGQEKGRLLGSCPFLPTQLNAHGEGYLTLPILTNTSGGVINVVGQVALHYLVVRPFVHAKNNLSNTWRSYWRERPPQGGGHRGMGRHFNQVGGFRKALTRENTLASFILAGRSGADFVEFDVQLTKDHVPVLYHDFIFRVGLEDKNAWSDGTRAEPHAIAIHQLTLRELTRSQTSVVPQKDLPRLKRLLQKHWNAILGRQGRRLTTRPQDPSRGTVGLVEISDDHLVDFYPRLQDLLQHVPPEIGLNIEIKYPDNFKRSSYRFSSSFAINYYLDTILACVFDHAAVGRRIFFSCFDPDIVVALRAKQATYPVFFLTYGRVQPTIDARLTLQFAHNFVKMEKLGGIVSNSDEFLTEPATVDLIKRDGIVLMTWGDQNTSHKCVQLQKRHAIDGVISDNIGDLTRADNACK